MLNPWLGLNVCRVFPTFRAGQTNEHDALAVPCGRVASLVSSSRLFCSAPLPRTLTAQRQRLAGSLAHESRASASRVAADKLKIRVLPVSGSHSTILRSGENLRNPNSRRNLTSCSAAPQPTQGLSASFALAASSPAHPAMPAWAEAALVLASPSPAAASSSTSSCGVVRPRAAAVEASRLFCKVSPHFPLPKL